MEIKNNPFYELRERLYSSASAGCSVIAEDFRLQRAIEAFKPVSEKNKVFGKLYTMCANLSSSANPAVDIADCIALADALAVTQGTFADNSETKPQKPIEIFKPQNITDSRLNEIINSIKYANVTKDYIYKVAKDPRIFNAYINSVSGESTSSCLISQIFEETYGDELVQPLIDSLDLKNEKASGQQVYYISRIGGAKYNDLYVSLAENESNPQKVRVKAIEAMSKSNENAEALLNLYRTEKGTIKNNALISLASLDSPIGDEELKEYLSKFRHANADVVSVSNRQVCKDYALKELEYRFVEIKPTNSIVAQHHDSPAAVSMLANKKNIDLSVFEKSADLISNHQVNDILARNIYFHTDSYFRELINSLYEKNPKDFFAAKFYMELKENTENIFDILQQKLSADNKQTVAFKLNALFLLGGKYRLPCFGSNYYADSKLNSPMPFSEFSDDMLKKLEECGFYFTQYNTFAIKKPKK